MINKQTIKSEGEKIKKFVCYEFFLFLKRIDGWIVNKPMRHAKEKLSVLQALSVVIPF